MKSKKFNKLWFGIYFLLWLFIDMSIYYTNTLNDMEKEYKTTINQKTYTIESLTVQLEKDHNSYRDTLDNIVVDLYERDKYQIGGVNISNVRLKKEEYLIKAIKNEITDFNKYLKYIENYFNERNIIQERIPSILPVAYHENVRITSPYGIRYYPLTNKLLFHEGIDISGDEGTKIISTAKGKVIERWIRHPIYGKMIKIDHGNGFITMYAHMSEIWVWYEKEIDQGEIVGIMGDTGRSVGRHLHYQITLNNETINPIDYLNSTVEF